MDQVQKFLTKLYRGAGGARARRCQNLLDRGLWDALTKEPSPDPRKYRYAAVLKRDRIVVDILRKCELPIELSSNDTRAEAVKTFYSCEAGCESTNKRLNRLSNNAEHNYFASREDLAMWEFLLLWRKNLSRFLGPLPKQLGLRFSSGATVSHRSNEGTIPDKMSLPGTIYPESQDIYRHSVRNSCLDYLENIPALEVITHNQFFTVAKDSSKDRGCCKEASASLLLQLDVGAVLKSIFRKRTGINLKHAKPLHMELARQASAGLRALSTIDLSNASDTVSYELVRLVLPPLWFDLLASLRATHTWIDGAMIKLAKFSSMGNGFTFELETILFYTLCKTIDASREVYTFGDDIIVEQAVANDVIQKLVYFGFTPNVNKTFCEGPFRESCGGDYFEGQAVRPHFMKEFPYEPQQWVVLANGLLRADPSLRWCRAAWRYAVDQVPSLWRNWVPTRFGDVGLHYPDGDREVPTAGTDPQFGPFYYGMVPVVRHRKIGKYEARIQYACALYGVGHTVALRGDPKGYRRQQLYEIGHNDPGSVIPYLVQFRH